MTQIPETPAAPQAPQPAPQRPMEAHRGGAVLALGILGLVICVICGIIAWAMGNGDLRKMDAGLMDPAGRGMTQAGKICGMISVILACVAVFIWLIIILGAAASA